jgi:hypothetical protein
MFIHVSGRNCYFYLQGGGVDRTWKKSAMDTGTQEAGIGVLSEPIRER